MEEIKKETVEMDAEKREKALKCLDALCGTVNLDKVTSEGIGFEELPEGYFLSELKHSELTLSSKGNPMVKMQFSVVQDGLAQVVDNDGEVDLVEAKNTKGRTFRKYYPLTDETSFKRFISDMKKFESKPGEPLLSEEYFSSSELIEAALGVLEGMRIYVYSSKSEKNGEVSTWYNLISWKRVEKLGLEN